MATPNWSPSRTRKTPCACGSTPKTFRIRHGYSWVERRRIMLILAKVALGLGVTVAAAGAYAFHEGVIRVDVDEQRNGGTHVHFWVPTTVVSTGLHFVPQEKMQSTARDVRPYLPVLREVSKEL